MSALPQKNSQSHYNSLPTPVKNFFDDQYRRSYQLVADLRYERTGVYRDAYVTRGQEKVASSIAATGVGLIALTIADMEGWEENAEEKVILTLKSMTGETPGFTPAKDRQTGFLRHWIDVNSGTRRWRAEISTVDTALLVSGALFAMNYFRHNEEIARLATRLYYSVRWDAAIDDPATGRIFLRVDNGRGIEPLAPYNEYAILANLARYDHRYSRRGETMWQKVFADKQLSKLPCRTVTGGRKIICEVKGIPSSFVYQFPFYLVHEYTLSPLYRSLCADIAFADRYDWLEQHQTPAFVWGHGAGVNSMGCYHADSIGNNPLGTASPYIIAGFLPVWEDGIYDLYNIYRTLIPYDKGGKHLADPKAQALFRAAYKYGLTRFEYYKMWGPKPWYPQHTAIIDWSTMLYGLTAFKHGTSFFAEHNCFSTLPDTIAQVS